MLELNFRKFLEQGTGATTTGLNAAGRAGQSTGKPEKPVSPPSAFNPSEKTLSKPPKSPFNVSDKTQTSNPTTSPFNFGVKPLTIPKFDTSQLSFPSKQPPLAFSPFGFSKQQPVADPSKEVKPQPSTKKI